MSEVPDFSVIMGNIANTLPSVFSVIAMAFMLLSFTMVFSGVMDLAQSTDKKKKYLGTHQATGWSGIIKILLGGVLANLAYSGDIAIVTSSIFFGDESDFTLMSIDSYVPSENENVVQKMVKVVLIGFTQVVGLLAIFKGIRIWAKASDKSGREGFWNGMNFIIFGTLCVQVARVMGVVQATIGFNFFKMIGLA